MTTDNFTVGKGRKRREVGEKKAYRTGLGGRCEMSEGERRVSRGHGKK